jgi:predicted glycogen debranching enzyme
MKIRLGRDEMLDLQISMKKEYLLTNGKGGFCSSTIYDCHSRKYHGLLVLPVKEQAGRLYNFLSKLEPKIIINGKEFHLSTNKFPVVYDPTGHKYINSFEIDYYPVTTYKIGDITFVKSILMPYGENTVLVKYDLISSELPVVLKVTPFMACREVNSLSKENMDIKPRAYFEENGFKFDPYQGVPPVYVQSSLKSTFYPAPQWWKNFEYTKERKRGYEFHEDLFVPGTFELKLKQGDSVIFRASLDPADKKITTEWNNEIKRISQLSDKFNEYQEPLKTFKISASQYVINYDNGQKGIIAGYHWFGEWGRDTLISLPGLTMCTGNYKDAFDILKKYTTLERDGLLPNIISDTGNHAYNSIDTPLLYFWAVQHYIEYSGDIEGVKKHIVPVLTKIITAFLDNRVPYCSHGGMDGFLYAGNEHTNLTWMDAVVDGNPVTPRNGAAIEINALWYNALCFLLTEFTSGLSPDLQSRIIWAKELFEHNFENFFWAEVDQCFCDRVVTHEYRELFIRPNQLFAIGLPYTCISKERALIALDTIDLHLLTPYGLRTLSQRNPRFRGEYKGEPSLRDLAYHQGMVWPWLVGIYTDAILKIRGKNAQLKKNTLANFSALINEHPQTYGLNHISELVRPNPPYVAKGCIAQAWSIAEVIRMIEMLK